MSKEVPEKQYQSTGDWVTKVKGARIAIITDDRSGLAVAIDARDRLAGITSIAGLVSEGACPSRLVARSNDAAIRISALRLTDTNRLIIHDQQHERDQKKRTR